QQAVRDDAPEPAERYVLDPADDSVVIHSCHGRARQVEVLRDAILRALADDPTLEPRDVIVMCPDIETYAPLIHATFGAGEVFEDEEAGLLDEDDAPPDTGPDLRVRLADRALRQTNPVLGVLVRLLELAGARLTASEVVDLADREPVRRRFGLDDDDLARLEDWVGASGVRWGLDAQHRAPFQLESVRQGTWEAGLDRVLLGVAMTEDDARLVGGVLPLDDVGSQDIDLAGRLGELVARLHDAVRALHERRTMDAWAQVLGELADALTATRPRDVWQRQELGRILLDVADEAGGAGAELTVDDVRALLADRLRGRPTRANFRTGHLTMCTLVPMRAVPHRVVCLLGLDDEVFPRAGARDGDDLVLQDPHAGDQDARLEDRQLLLDALMSAQDRLIVTFRGRDERTNVPRPPCVPIGELLDVIDCAAVTSDGRPATAQVVVEHPLQPFDPRNFQAPARSFDSTMLDGASALQGPRAQPAGSFLAERLAPWRTDVVELDDLVRFAERPIRTFLRDRLGITVGSYDDELADALPVETDNLERWAIGDRLLHARLRGIAMADAADAERARGTLPPGTLGERVLAEVAHDVEQLAGVARRRLDLTAEPLPLDVRVTLPDGRLLGGTVATAGDTVRLVTYSRLGPKHRLAAWARLLALTVSHPDRDLQAVTIARGVTIATL
ncbi:MAG TPA: hypothetical protein VD931_11085, partial [Baekduia sp.]|nr:hypothetical protein [Baekduia sp.]